MPLDQFQPDTQIPFMVASGRASGETPNQTDALHAVVTPFGKRAAGNRSLLV